MECEAVAEIPLNWHSSFFLQLVMMHEVNESVLLEYLKLLIDLLPTPESLFLGVRGAFEPTLLRCARRLIKALFEAVQGVMDLGNGKSFILLHLRNGLPE